MSRPADARPDDAAFRVRVETFALLRRLLPVGALAGSLVGPFVFVDSSTAVWLSMALFFGTLFVCWTLQGLPLYPAHTFGIEYRFEDERFASDRRQCIRCEAVIEDGTHRRYARQFVVLGVPVHTLAWGDNEFCPDCLEADPDVASGSESRETRESAPGAGGSGNSREETERTHSAGDTTYTQQAGKGPGTDIVRRIDLNDERTALEVERAFDGGDSY
ncbi:hypothetical protein [Natronorubrum texcoconense]|uniref:DUF8108 domain-containing protein n=1 Tax=Natronorubrum texcoconense TaxID=1095776 RepID=A0A1G8WZH3_9EURY|nr:hypothetical protein [Natronorubrum texcoconense]SDJ83673.1 hypothetical protein SAMN04515672_1563 [Natronorubrum texcoconense]